MLYLSLGDVCHITGISANTIKDWCMKEIIIPAEGGEGHGSHRRFTVMQVLGISVGIAEINSRRGCCLAYVGDVVRAFGTMSEDDLKTQLEAGNTHLCSLHHGKPWLRPPEYPTWTNVEKCYADVSRAIRRIRRELKANDRGGRGRKRGLAITE